jgi:hypothetical protein
MRRPVCDRENLRPRWNKSFSRAYEQLQVTYDGPNSSQVGPQVTLDHPVGVESTSRTRSSSQDKSKSTRALAALKSKMVQKGGVAHSITFTTASKSASKGKLVPSTSKAIPYATMVQKVSSTAAKPWEGLRGRRASVRQEDDESFRAMTTDQVANMHHSYRQQKHAQSARHEEEFEEEQKYAEYPSTAADEHDQNHTLFSVHQAQDTPAIIGPSNSAARSSAQDTAARVGPSAHAQSGSPTPHMGSSTSYYNVPTSETPSLSRATSASPLGSYPPSTD